METKQHEQQSIENNRLEKALAREDFDPANYVDAVVEHEAIRNILLRWMLLHPHIMVYYHCYDVISIVSKQNPQLIYPHWDDISSLLQHENSYHRNFALDILASLVQVDTERHFDALFDVYFARLDDEKFKTALCCVKYSARIVRNRPDLLQSVLQKLLHIDSIAHYPARQIALLKYNILVIIEENRRQIEDQNAIHNFILQQADSISPKTRKKAREMLKEFSI